MLKKDAKKAAEDRLGEIKKEIELDNKIEPKYKGITFGKFADDLINHEKLHMTANTIKSKKTAVNKFSRIRDIALIELKNMDIQKCADGLLKDGLKISTIKTYLTKIKYILDQAVIPYKIIPSNPMQSIKLPVMQYSENENDVKILEKDQIAKLFDFFKSKKIYEKYYYLCSFALGTGLRRGELLGLTWDNVDFKNNEIHVVRQWKLLDGDKEGFGTLKKKNSKRVVPVSQNTMNELAEYKAKFNVIGIDNRVFPFVSKSVTRNIAYVSKKIGMDVNIHMLRHTYATNLIANGVDFKTAAA
ncbi:MAG TPA: site-specific integrase, partial [Clostridium sp.]|nr:site-specific integrase [Clostridium sp.]